MDVDDFVSQPFLYIIVLLEIFSFSSSSSLAYVTLSRWSYLSGFFIQWASVANEIKLSTPPLKKQTNKQNKTAFCIYFTVFLFNIKIRLMTDSQQCNIHGN